jgi:hypothetical protein
MPAHEAIDNEAADQLAKLRSDSACGISAGIAKKAVRDWI